MNETLLFIDMVRFIDTLTFVALVVTEALADLNLTGPELARDLLRKNMMEKNLKMEDCEVALESSMITLSLWHLPAYNNSKRIAVYLHKKGEPETDDILAGMFKARKRVYVPRYTDEYLEMVRVKSPRDLATLKEDKNGVRQPRSKEKREEALLKRQMKGKTSGLDMIIMPGLAFTRAGRRLGRGNGLMHKYVLKARRICWPVLVGLAYIHQVVPNFPQKSDDLKLDYVLDSEHADHFEDYEEKLEKMERRFKPLNQTDRPA